ncbi:unnamed protein product [Protopolystoma xenopodis]|uniref:Uncharacterized protein n=1 Tax=Protopolystoma xenopodis TaxID=117903 RepID=A0A3S5BCN9_9PLAT|nr:unnamed protein product [Protopolystoma xenopodis]
MSLVLSRDQLADNYSRLALTSVREIDKLKYSLRNLNSSTQNVPHFSYSNSNLPPDPSKPISYQEILSFLHSGDLPTPNGLLPSSQLTHSQPSDYVPTANVSPICSTATPNLSLFNLGRSADSPPDSIVGSVSATILSSVPPITLLSSASPLPPSPALSKKISLLRSSAKTDLVSMRSRSLSPPKTNIRSLYSSPSSRIHSSESSSRHSSSDSSSCSSSSSGTSSSTTFSSTSPPLSSSRNHQPLEKSRHSLSPLNKSVFGNSLTESESNPNSSSID